MKKYKWCCFTWAHDDNAGGDNWNPLYGYDLDYPNADMEGIIEAENYLDAKKQLSQIVEHHLATYWDRYKVYRKHKYDIEIELISVDKGYNSPDFKVVYTLETAV